MKFRSESKYKYLATARSEDRNIVVFYSTKDLSKGQYYTDSGLSLINYYISADFLKDFFKYVEIPRHEALKICNKIP